MTRVEVCSLRKVWDQFLSLRPRLSRWNTLAYVENLDPSSSPSASPSRSVPGTWVTDYCGDMGNTLVVSCL